MTFQKTALRGTAGLSIIIGMILAGSVYVNYHTQPSLTNLDPNGIYTDHSIYRVGDKVTFYLRPSLTSDPNIDSFIWDFHDGDVLYTSTRADTSVWHTFTNPGTYTVSVIAIKGPISKIFTIPLTILPSINVISINTTSSSYSEGTNVTFNALDSFSFDPILNFVWDFGDGNMAIGQSVSHVYNYTGTYNVRVRGYTNDTYIYSAFKAISILNQKPTPTMITPGSVFTENYNIPFSATVQETSNDLPTLKYIWDFGDNLMAQGPDVTHSYLNPGKYNVTLYTIDDNGVVGSTSREITINNQAPVINQLTNERSYYSQGETIKTTAVVNDTLNDMNSMQYSWSIPGDGQVNAYPFFKVGNYSLGLNVTDNNGVSASATTLPFQVINVAPYISLLNAYSDYNISFRTWGTLNTKVNITFFENGPNNYTNNNLNNPSSYNQTYMFTNQTNYQMTNLYTNITNSQYALSITNLRQPLNEYWDLLINSTNNQTYDTYVETTFNFTNHSPISVINHCTSQNSTCLASSYRFPTAPIDRSFPVTYNFSVFDPGNDNLTASIDMGGIVFSKNVTKAAYGPTSTTVAIQAYLPQNIYPGDIRYYVTDEHGGRSANYTIPFTNYALTPTPPDYINKTTWNYFGFYIEHYASDGVWLVPSQISVGKSETFIFNTNQQEVNVTNSYTWHFGDGFQSVERFPSHVYDQKGVYLLWVVVKDSYYEHVSYMWVNVTAQFPSYHPFIQGIAASGSELNFTVSGLNTTNGTYYVNWDFGDGSTGSGAFTTHAYTMPGNYTVVVTLTNIFNQKDYSDIVETIGSQPPVLKPDIATQINLMDGAIQDVNPNVFASPYDLLHLSYKWNLDGVTNTSAYVTLTSEKPHNTGSVVITNPEGLNYNETFTYDVSVDPLELSLFPNYYLYGKTNSRVFINGTVSTSALFRNSYTNNTKIEYQLLGNTGNIVATGTGSFDPSNFGFSVPINVSQLETNATIQHLQQILQSPLDLTPAVNPSGPYQVNILLVDNTTHKVLTQKQTTIKITFDEDGDFLPDALEILYTNTLGQKFSIYSQDTNNNSIVDPVEKVLGVDKDGDGLPKFYEDIIGTSDNNPDTDGDGLTDGFGPHGELTYGTNPLSNDTDHDGLSDYQEVMGWQIKVITPQGVVVKTVHSNPLSNDTDHDGLSDYQEYQLGTDPTTNDTDHDGLTDLQEQKIGTNPNNYDTDFDGIPDGIEVNTTFTASYTGVNGTIINETYKLNPLSPDTDHDGLSDYQEAYVYHTSGTNPDTDLDGLSDFNETVLYHTNPLKADTDGDGLSDGMEVAGFNIPVVNVIGGVYNESGGIITAPIITNTTVHVTTNPLNPDTDGDGLTDGQEILANNGTKVSNPTMIDSDGDGVPDNLDSQPLIADYEPPSVTSKIDVSYSVQPSSQVASYYGYLTTDLSTIWNDMKGAGNLVGDIIGYSFYWTTSCWTVHYPWWLGGGSSSVCSSSLHTRSFSDVENYAISRMESYIHDNINTVFPSAPNWQVQFPTINFYNFGMSIQKNSIGVPIGFSFSGFAELIVQNFYSYISGFIDPTVTLQANIQDNNGLQKIEIYQNNALVKTISNINSKQYDLNEAFSIGTNGFSLQQTTFMVKIYDLNNNIREFSRTLANPVKDAITFSINTLNQGITVIKEAASAIVNFASQAWNWALGGIAYLGSSAVAAANAVSTFATNVYNEALNWVSKQFNSFWEDFVRNTMSSLMSQSLDAARAGFDQVSSIYASIPNKENTVKPLFDGTVMNNITSTISSFSSDLSSIFPSFDVSSQTKEIANQASAISSALGVTVIAQAINKIGNDAINILNKIVYQTVQDIVSNNIDKELKELGNALIPVLSQFSSSLIKSYPNPAISSMDILQTITQFQDFLGNLSSPFTFLKNFLNNFSAGNLLSIIQFALVYNPSQAVNIENIIKSIISPVTAVGYALYGLFNLVSTTNMFEKPEAGLVKNEQSFINSATLTMPATPQLISSLTVWGLQTIGFITKEIGIPKNAVDRQADKDVEIALDPQYTHNYLPSSPQFNSAVGMFLNGALTYLLSLVGFYSATTNNADTGTLLNLQHYEIVGYTRTALSLLYMIVLFGFFSNHIYGHPGINDPDAVASEVVFFILNLGISIYDAWDFTSLVSTYAQGTLDLIFKSIDISVKYLDMLRDILILSTNNGQRITGAKAKLAFQAFSYGFSFGLKLPSLFMDFYQMIEFTHF